MSGSFLFSTCAQYRGCIWTRSCRQNFRCRATARVFAASAQGIAQIQKVMYCLLLRLRETALLAGP